MKPAHLLRSRKAISLTAHAWERLDELQAQLGTDRDVIADALVRARLTIKEARADVNRVLDDDTRMLARADE